MFCKRMPRSELLLIVVIMGASVVAARAAMPRFEYHKIAEVGREMGQTSLVDIDKDGDLDWSSASGRGRGGSSTPARTNGFSTILARGP